MNLIQCIQTSIFPFGKIVFRKFTPTLCNYFVVICIIICTGIDTLVMYCFTKFTLYNTVNIQRRFPFTIDE